MQGYKRVNENEEVEKIALSIEDNEIEVWDDKGNVIGKISTKQIVKKALEKRTLKFRIKDALGITLSGEDEKTLPGLKDLYFDSHLLIYGKGAHEVRTTGYVCPLCGLEIDEYGYCGCGSGSA